MLITIFDSCCGCHVLEQTALQHKEEYIRGIQQPNKKRDLKRSHNSELIAGFVHKNVTFSFELPQCSMISLASLLLLAQMIKIYRGMSG